MKKLLTILLILITAQSFAQEQGVYQKLPIYGANYKRIRTDSALLVPVKAQTVNSTDSSAQFFYNIQDSSFWGYSKDRGFFKVSTDRSSYHTIGQASDYFTLNTLDGRKDTVSFPKDTQYVKNPLYSDNDTLKFHSDSLTSVLKYSGIDSSAYDDNTLVDKGYISDRLANFLGGVWSKTGTAAYYLNNVLIGTNTDDGHQLRVNGTIEFNIGSDAVGDIFYRDSLGTFTRLPAPVGFTKPVLGFSTYPHWQEDSTGGGQSVVLQTVTSGTTVTVNNTTTWLAINPSSTLSSLTITLPASPTNGQLIDISFGGTITTANAAVVTSLLVVANTGQGLIGTGTYGQVVTEDHIAYRYNSSLSKWFRN